MNRVIAYIYVLGTQIFEVPLWRDVRIQCSNLICTDKFRLCIVLLFLVLIGEPNANATAIAVLKYGPFVYIAADTLVTPIDQTASPTHKCKIHQLRKNRFLALAGLTEGNPFDPIVIAEAENSKELGKAVQGFYFRMRSVLPATIRVVLRSEEARKQMSKELQGELPWISAVFAEYNGQTAIIQSVEIFSAVGSVDRFRPVYRSCPGNCPTGSIFWQFANRRVTQDEAMQLVAQSGTAEKGMATIIAEESRRNPKTVSKPVDVLILEPGRAYWASDYHQLCEGIK